MAPLPKGAAEREETVPPLVGADDVVAAAEATAAETKEEAPPKRGGAETVAAAGATAGDKKVPLPDGATMNGLEFPETAAKARGEVPATTEAYEGRIGRAPGPERAPGPGNNGAPEGVKAPERKGAPKGAVVMEAREAAKPEARGPGACGVTASESIEALRAAWGRQATEPGAEEELAPEEAPETKANELEDIKTTRVGAG